MSSKKDENGIVKIEVKEKTKSTPGRIWDWVKTHKGGIIGIGSAVGGVILLNILKNSSDENYPTTLGSDNTDDGYNDIPDYSGYCPDCPECMDTMGYSYLKSEFKCSSCGYIMGEDEWEFDDDGDIPCCCDACGGPYPNCTTSCKIFDD